MLSNERISGIQKLINDIDSAVKKETNASELYYLAQHSHSLYGRDIPEISDLFEELKDSSGLIVRHLRAIRDLLIDYIKRERDIGIFEYYREYLINFPEPLKQFDSAIIKYKTGVFERNTLDDMRLALELLLRDVLGNSKRLELQISPLGKALEEKTNKNVREMLTTLLTHFGNYQNETVKHHDKITSNEVEFVLELACVMMKMIVVSLS